MAPREQVGIDRTRGRVFGEVAELYDATRPGYPQPLVREVLAYAALGGRAAPEVGAGTGKATVPFAAAGTPRGGPRRSRRGRPQARDGVRAARRAGLLLRRRPGQLGRRPRLEAGRRVPARRPVHRPARAPVPRGGPLGHGPVRGAPGLALALPRPAGRAARAAPRRDRPGPGRPRRRHRRGPPRRPVPGPHPIRARRGTRGPAAGARVRPLGALRTPGTAPPAPSASRCTDRRAPSARPSPSAGCPATG